VWLGKPGGQVVARGIDAVLAAAAELRLGRVLAMRGVGGYQLVVDATSSHAVRELRRRKRREGKPLAVMVESLAAAETIAELNDGERKALCGPANPIVLVRAKSPTVIALEVAAGLNTLGLMLPTTPLHFAILRQCGRPLVVTSGNIEGEPLEHALGAAEREFAGLADCWLDHNRPIVRPIDDSVVRVIAGRPATIRLARGMAPLPLSLPASRILALGGHQKVAVALSNDAQTILGPHVGDMGSEASRIRFVQHIESLQQLVGAQPDLLVCDEHPDYFTTRWAGTQQLPRLDVQHHHAHVAAAMLEFGWLDRQVLGVAWDGSGYGPDGTIWGGEFLLATAAQYRRVAHLRSFVLPGGERAVREPWRVAVSLVHQAAGAEAAARLRFADVGMQQVEQTVNLLERSHRWPATTSAGRLFDGIAALVLGAAQSQFEGQPAMLLESVCDETETDAYPLPILEDALLVLDWRPVVRAVLSDVALGRSPGTISMRFHRALVAGVVALSQRFGPVPVVLCGGCFQNRVLTELVATELTGQQPVATPGVIPTGDGGLAAGQLAVAAARLVEGLTCA
jgi:hydrogenase maturation protein HypF